MNTKHQKTLQAIFEVPTASAIEWHDVEALLIAGGAEISEGRGSRVRIYLNGVRAVFHQPHPQKEIDKGTVRAVRRFLAEAGIKP